MLYLHIGTPKAGSTTIQKFLCDHPDLLADTPQVDPFGLGNAIYLTDTPDQTRAVLTRLADDDAAEPDLARWHDLQVWLESGEHEVSIPYAKPLAELVPPVAVRLRRDFCSVLSLIRSHALLHQATRERDDRRTCPRRREGSLRRLPESCSGASFLTSPVGC